MTPWPRWERNRTEAADSALTEVKAYLRSYDGDYLLSALEERAFLSARSAPMADRLPVSNATFEDPDADLVDAFVASIRKAVGGFTDRGELLRRSGVLHSDGRPTVAGVLALGLYPRQWFPRFVIQAAAEPATALSRMNPSRLQRFSLALAWR